MFKFLILLLTFMFMQQFALFGLLRNSKHGHNDDKYDYDLHDNFEKTVDNPIAEADKDNFEKKNDDLENIKEDLPDNLHKTIDDLVTEPVIEEDLPDNFDTIIDDLVVEADTDDGDLEQIKEDLLNLKAEVDTETNDDDIEEIEEDDYDLHDNFETKNDDPEEIKEDLPGNLDDLVTEADFETNDDDFEEIEEDLPDEITDDLVVEAHNNNSATNDETEKNDFEDSLFQIHDVITTGLNTITKAFRNITDTYILSVLALRTPPLQGIIKRREKNVELHDSIKQKADEAGIDIEEICEFDVFLYEESYLQQETLEFCIDDEVNSGLENIRSHQKDLINYVLEIGYKQDIDITWSPEMNSAWLEDVKVDVMVIPGEIENRLIVARGLIAPSIAEVQTCVDNVSTRDPDREVVKQIGNCVNFHISKLNSDLH